MMYDDYIIKELIMSTEFKKKYVEILSNPSTDYKAIALQLAVIDPEMFVECATSTTSTDKNELSETERETLVWLNREGYIGAIKNHRAKYNATLKIAKDNVDSMRQKFYTIGFLKQEND